MGGVRPHANEASHIKLHISMCTQCRAMPHHAMRVSDHLFHSTHKETIRNSYSPTVPLPPTGIIPKRLNGTENVTTLGVTSRITMTSAGLAGMSLFDMLLLLSALWDDVEKGLWMGTMPLSTPKPIAAAGKRRKAVLRGPGPLELLLVGLLPLDE